MKVITGESHWSRSKYHSHLRESEYFSIDIVTTFDVCIPYRGRQAHFFLFPRAIKALSEFDPDVVVIGLSNVPTNVIVARWCVKSGIPYVWHGIGSMYAQKSLLRRLLDKPIRWLLTNAEGGIAFNQESKNYYHREYAIHSDRIHVVPNVVDTRRVVSVACEVCVSVACEVCSSRRPDDGETSLVYVGALQRAKRVDVVLEAVSILRDRGMATTGIIVGDGPERASLESLIRRLGIEASVRLVGSRSFDESTCILANADVAILPGLGGLAVSHALASGTPVVTSEADGSARDQIVYCANGIVLDDVNAESVADAVTAIMQHGIHKRNAWFHPSVRMKTRELEISAVGQAFVHALQSML